ncbi:uncharacterized protein LOC142980670 [Anticarsia gemmatalis]|uniref:uncharacterized protein LOC142980670 n=1 Tax=Anticarsia gemmatalis TaxID=129554 RepID=UPI003F767A8F
MIQYVLFVLLSHWLCGVMSHSSDNGETSTSAKLVSVMPKSCEGKPYCCDNEHYPTEAVEKALAALKTKLDIIAQENDSSYESREGEEEPECDSNRDSRPIYYIKDTEDRLRVVVQVKDKFTQHYDLRWCKKAGNVKSTKHLTRSMAEGYDVRCENVNLDIIFYVLSLTPDLNNTYGIESAKTTEGIPVNCICRYKKED